MQCPIDRASDLFYYKSPRMVGVVVKALEGREERQGLDLTHPAFDDPVGSTG